MQQQKQQRLCQGVHLKNEIFASAGLHLHLARAGRLLFAQRTMPLDPAHISECFDSVGQVRPSAESGSCPIQ